MKKYRRPALLSVAMVWVGAWVGASENPVAVNLVLTVVAAVITLWVWSEPFFEERERRQ